MTYVYGYDGCTYCKQAIMLLKQKSISFTYFDIKDPALKNQLTFLKDSGLTTVPQIFINDNHIGGFDELTSLLENT
jgi:glutaredoxin 3